MCSYLTTQVLFSKTLVRDLSLRLAGKKRPDPSARPPSPNFNALSVIPTKKRKRGRPQPTPSFYNPPSQSTIYNRQSAFCNLQSLVGAARFELAASWSRTKRASQAAPRPVSIANRRLSIEACHPERTRPLSGGPSSREYTEPSAKMQNVPSAPIQGGHGDRNDITGIAPSLHPPPRTNPARR